MTLNAKVGEGKHNVEGHICLVFKDYSKNKPKPKAVAKARFSSSEFCSDKFCSHQGGYAFQLMVKYYGPPNNDIGAFLYLVKGNNDDKLTWPLTVSVTLELLNQAGDHSHVREECKILNWFEVE